jgi:hypothetical protein
MNEIKTTTIVFLKTYGIALSVIVLASVFISNDSLWIDEGYAASKALQGSLSEWYSTLTSEGGSDSQMPGYMFFIWLWAKIAGSSEMALRMSNLVWLLLAAFTLRSRPLVLVALVTSPITLYYANELRPYMMQIGAAAMVFGGLLRLKAAPSSSWSQVLCGCMLLCMSSLLGAIWSAGILLYVVVAQPVRLKQTWFWKALGLSSPFFLVLGLYYFNTLLAGQGGAPMGGGILTSIGAAGYELLGLMGLGPGRIELRVDPASAIRYAPILVPSMLIMTGAVLSGGFLYARDFTRREWIAISVAIGFPLIIFLALILFRDFRLLGRHLAPLAVLIAACIARCFGGISNRPFASRLLSVLGMAAVVVSLASAVFLRFAERHRKDDYKGAAALALESVGEGRKVLWAACRVTGEYYGIAPDNPGFITWGGEKPVQLPLPEGNERVFLTKPDIADPDGRLQEWLGHHDFKVVKVLQAFYIYELQHSLKKHTR